MQAIQAIWLAPGVKEYGLGGSFQFLFGTNQQITGVCGTALNASAVDSVHPLLMAYCTRSVIIPLIENKLAT